MSNRRPSLDHAVLAAARCHVRRRINSVGREENIQRSSSVTRKHLTCRREPPGDLVPFCLVDGETNERFHFASTRPVSSSPNVRASLSEEPAQTNATWKSQTTSRSLRAKNRELSVVLACPCIGVLHQDSDHRFYHANVHTPSDECVARGPDDSRIGVRERVDEHPRCRRPDPADRRP